jgi:two-component system, LytTR family, response regulator
MYTVIIIDDEKMARTLLESMVAEYCPDMTVVALCPDLPTGVKAIRKLKPDLIFLDIEMPGHSGLDLLGFFNDEEIDFSIIFTTAYSEYAIQAFKLSAIDYLLKPILPEDFEAAIALFKKQSFKGNYAELKENLKADSPKKLAIPTPTAIKFVELEQVMFIKADGAYSHIFLADHTEILSSKSLKTYEDTLQSNAMFFRCHKSYIVNLKFISDYVKSDGGYLIIQNKYEVGLSHDKVASLISLIV